jgi:O-acetyl-ADP-ribose deacetylase (regulator of RNase III)
VDVPSIGHEARWHGTRVLRLAGDITRVSVDAVVNTANSALASGGDVDRAIDAGAGSPVAAEQNARCYRHAPERLA